MSPSRRPSRAPAPQSRAPDIADKVAFLSRPGTYGLRRAVTVVETHMSWLFLTGSLAYKLKKPVRYPFLDFTTLERREYFCREELRLNRRLAPDVYLDVVPLRATADGRLSLGGDGETVDWLVEMRRLHRADMLDRRLALGTVEEQDMVRVLELLGRFYASAEPERRDGGEYLRHLEVESAVNRKLLLRADWDLPQPRTGRLLDRVEALLERAHPLIEARIAEGRIVEGHGDLRPEHVHLGVSPQVFDCLEFDRSMRILDPYDEVNYLGMECEMHGAPWIRDLALATLDRFLGGRPEPRLLATYGAFRALLRARISMAHLLDPEPMTPRFWPEQARRYLAIAERECLTAEG